jgi:hypothetical protein
MVPKPPDLQLNKNVRQLINKKLSGHSSNQPFGN